MPAYPITASLVVVTDAINVASFTATDAVGAALSARNSVAAGPVQNSLATTRLASSTAVGGRATQMFNLMQTTLAAQDDAIEVLGYLLAHVAASRCASKYQTAALIAQVEEIATLALDEIMGLRPMPLHRPDADQLSELTRAATAARSQAGLNALPSLH